MSIACAYDDITCKTQVAVAVGRFIAKCNVPSNGRVIDGEIVARRIEIFDDLNKSRKHHGVNLLIDIRCNSSAS